MWPVLFNTYSEENMRKILEGVTAEIKVNERLINNCRYADDPFILVDNLENLQRMVHRIVEHSRELSINTKKRNL